MDRSLVAEPYASFGFIIKNDNFYPYALCIISLSPHYHFMSCFRLHTKESSAAEL